MPEELEVQAGCEVPVAAGVGVAVALLVGVEPEWPHAARARATRATATPNARGRTEVSRTKWRVPFLVGRRRRGRPAGLLLLRGTLRRRPARVLVDDMRILPVGRRDTALDLRREHRARV